MPLASIYGWVSSAMLLKLSFLLGAPGMDCFCLQAGLGNWISLRGLATGAVIAQWWLASAFYRFQGPRTGALESTAGSSNSFVIRKGAAKEDSTEELTFFREGQEGKEWLFDDPEFPTAFRDET